ncbi:hypothetical protein MA16_Dca024589 [Dendrobium catenatum]|uniref:Uncharacterized protein n=1 Tax=Dendrobium catenatum TaxID=906689 RepID=A0A2I0WWU5_9ASPA|nr:hypothetical protein MA16_Dca024589 [Dendrobium catenatum]
MKEMGNPSTFKGRENLEVKILKGEDGMPPLEQLSREEMSIGYARRGTEFVKQLTNNIQYIIDTLRLSSVVEVQGEKIRRRNDWSKWLNAANQFGSSGARSPTTTTTTYDAMTSQFQNFGLENSSKHNSMRGSADPVIAGSASGDFNSQQSVDGQS